MLTLIAGLALFLGVHSTRIVAEDARRRFIAERGENVWKGLYSVASLIGIVLVSIGYGRAQETPVFLWFPPAWLGHVALLLTAVAFVLLAAAYVPGNRIRAAVGHPMVLGVKVWAFSHLLVNGELASVILFGAFLVWAIADFAAARRRDRREAAAAGGAEIAGGTPPADDVTVGGSGEVTAARVSNGGTAATLAAVGIGLVAWVAFAGWLHRWLIGVSPIVVGGA